MIQWLQNYSGTGIHGVNVEKSELQNLRKEIKHYKKKYEKEDKEILILSDNEEKETQEEQDLIDEEIKKKQQKQKQRRETISDEAITKEEISNIINFNPQIDSKSSEVIETIKRKISNLFFFNNLSSEEELSVIINSFNTENIGEGETIFKQGENADKLYILDKGELDCWKTFKMGDPETYIKSYKEGDSFGELALLYNYKRNYTIKAKTDAVLFSLDRKTYKSIVLGNELKQREIFATALKRVDIFQNLTPNEFGKICDIMVIKFYQEGEEIIKQNENEDDFVILHQGKCHSEKASDSGKPPQTLKEFEENDYFGEAPWFKYEQRNYSVKADTDCIVFIISRKEFKRLVGPLENILKRKIESYQKFMKK